MSHEYIDIPLNWVNTGNEYVAETPFGRAIITEVDEPAARKFNFGTHSYRLRLEYVSGEVETVHHVLDSLSIAQGWAHESFQNYEAKHREHGELKSLLDTLDLCRQSLPPGTKDANLQRIDRIELIVKTHFESIQ